MANDMGNITGHMTGRVIRGEDIERVLAQVPEQVWTWDDDRIEAPDGTIYYTDTNVPMAKRREIISHILCTLPD